MQYIGNYEIINKDNTIYVYKNKPIKFIGNSEQMIKNIETIFNTDINKNSNTDIIYYDIYTIKKTGGIYFHQFIETNLIPIFKNPNLIKNIKKCATVENVWGLNYYHALIEELPNILKIKQFDEKLPILCSYNDTYVKNILTYFEITNSIIEPYNIYKIDELYIPNQITCGNPSKEDLFVIRNYLNRKILISIQNHIKVS